MATLNDYLNNVEEFENQEINKIKTDLLNLTAKQSTDNETLENAIMELSELVGGES